MYVASRKGIFKAKGHCSLLPLSKGSGGLKSQTSRPLTKSMWEQGTAKAKAKDKGELRKAKLKKNINYKKISTREKYYADKN